MEAFRVHVGGDVLDDLESRLRRTRFASPTPLSGADAGISPALLREWVDYWADGFDWRAAEAQINQYPQFLATIGDVRMHFVYRRASDPDAPTVLLLHGWPYTFVEMLPLSDQLSEYSVVVPSLPGFGFSTTTDGYAASTTAIADTAHSLMTDVLGVRRYFVYGEDVGAPVCQLLAASRPAVAGIHDTHAVFVPRDEVLSQEEHDFYAWFDAQWDGAKGYAAPGSTRHDTIAASIADSPAGLAAWMLEKFRDWSDCAGDLERQFTKDQLLTTITIYWVTDTFVSSFRPYQAGMVAPAMPRVPVPATVAVQRHEQRYPRSFAERSYAELRRFGIMPRGGHFAAAENPDLVAADIRWLITSTATAPPASATYRP